MTVHRRVIMLLLGIIFMSLVAFTFLNNIVLLRTITLLISNTEPILIFLVIVSVVLVALSFQSRRSIAVGLFLPLAFYLFVVIVHGLLSTCSMFYVHLQTPVTETVDFGLAGFFFILIDGLLASHILTEGDLNATERLLLAVGLGFGVNILLMTLLGILWEISLLTILTSQAIFMFIMLAANLRKNTKLNINKLKDFFTIRQNITLHLSWIKIALITLISFYVAVASYQVIAYPAIEWDSLAYGLNYAKIIFKNKKIPVIAGPSIGLEMSASYPPGVQLLAVYFYAFSGMINDFYYRILQPIFGIAVMITTYNLAKILTENKIASLFAVFLLSIAPIYWEFFIRESYIMCLTFMWALSTYFFFKAYSLDGLEAKKCEAIGTLFCGFSSLTSYIGLLSLGTLALYAIYRKISLKRLIGLATLALFVLFPWYLRNLLLLGNPLFPFFGFGINLDPLLMTSTLQHFQSWLRGSLALINLFSIIACVASSAILYILFFSRQKNKHKFAVCLALYSLVACALVMLFHVPFLRYLSFALPIFSTIISLWIQSSFKRDLAERSIATTFIILAVTLSIATVPYLNIIKPMYAATSKWEYLTQFYEDADAWKWINENTPLNARIATFEIREYYIERDVMLLDGYTAAPLYRTENIEDAINHLRKQNVTHILSVSWASPMDARMPPAYKWCVLTRYLGDPQYLPPVYVSSNGAAVYHVGPVDEDVLHENFLQKGLVPPLKHLQTNITITNQTSPPSGRIHIPIPFDYREGLAVISTNSYEQPVYIELWEGIITETLSSGYGLIGRWPATRAPVRNPSFVWEINKAGYLTILITAPESIKEDFNITVTMDFYNYWDKETLFLNKDSKIYNLKLTVKTFPLLKVLYIQVNEPSILTVTSATFGKKISLEIFEGLVPNNAPLANWGEQYKLMTKQPSRNEEGEQNPSIKNFFLSYGKYSLLV
ncbi:MAG: hypothetical protein QW279_05695, partial [Candidatus Jordarchaeaceae archaeon]